MNDLRTIIARNIQSLRTENKLTQQGLADILNYSDKAISKWERAEAIPDITVLKQLADYFGVSVDYLLEQEHTTSLSERRMKELLGKNRLIITLISIIGVFALATLVFSLLIILGTPSPWLTFIYALPVASIVALVLSSVWGKKSYNLIIISILIWSVLAAAYLSLLLYVGTNWWALFLVGIPSQAILFALFGLTARINRKERTDGENTRLNSDSAEKTE